MATHLMTAIEITDSHIKLFQSQLTRGQWHVSACEVRPLQRFTDDEIVNLLVELTRSKTIDSDNLTLVVSRRLAIVKAMKLPSHNVQELKKMIGLQLVNQIPYAVDDVIYDYQITNKDAEGYTYVSVYAVHKEVIQKYLKYLEKINLLPTRLTISSFGIISYLLYHRDKKSLNLPLAYLVVNVDMVQSEILFLHQGNLIYSRHVSFGAKDLQEEHVVGLAEQIQLSLAKYDKDRLGPTINKVLIVSMLERAQLLRQDLQERLKIPVELTNFIDKVPAQKNVSLAEATNLQGISLATGLGLVLSEPKVTINLTPQEVHEGKRVKIFRQQFVQFVVLFAGISMLTLAVLGVEVYKKQIILSRVEADLKSMGSEKRGVEQKMKSLEEFKAMMHNRVFMPDLLATIYEVTPSEVSYRSISINEQGEMALQGYCENSSGVNNLQARLIKSPVFTNVNLQFATKRKIFNMDVTDFRINAQLKSRSET